MDVVGLLTSLVSGAVGGNVAGALAKQRSLGPLLNSILGAVGGGVGGQLLPLLITALQGGGMAQNAGLSAVVGAVLPLLVSMFRKKA
jgi:uncharacterized membrane protein YeaQ/YmgE (transglycosylase-associated protein family)